MGEFFNLEGPLISFLDKCGRVILLGIFWIICCLPVVTIGPSSAALYYGITKTIRHERSGPAKEFFKCFKRVLKKGIVLTVIFGAAIAILALDILVWFRKSTKSSLVSMNACIILLIVILAITCYVFPVLSRFNYGIKDLIKLSAFMALKHLPYTILDLLVLALSALLVWCLNISIVFVPGVACIIISIMMENIFKKYIPKPGEGEEVWYDE
jgi:uncharacterized membrane protein YesL